MNTTTEHKVVTMSMWEVDSFREHLESEGWEVYGYSDYYFNGRTHIPTKVELKRQVQS